MIAYRFPAALTALLALGLAPTAGAADDFYKGRTVQLMVPSSLGASMGLYGRVLAAALEKYTPGNPNVILQERPGAGGVTGTAYAYNAGPSDGTLLAMISAGNVLLPMLRDNVRYDVTKMQWIGSIAVRPSVMWFWHTAPAKSIEDAKNVEVIVGSTGQGSGMTLWPRLMNGVIGTKFKVIEGYKGGAEVNNAAERGETHGRWASYSAVTAGAERAWVTDGKIRMVIQFGPTISGLPGAPSLRDLVTNDDDRKLVAFMELSERIGLGMWMRPGVPRERIETMRKAMAAALADPEVVADAEKRRAPIEPLTGEAIEQMVADAYSLTPAQGERLRTMLGFKK